MAKRIEKIVKDYPYLACEEDGAVIGYAYAHRHMVRAAYQWNAELSVYLDRNFTAKGLGKKFYTLLIEILKLQGIRTVYGGVTSPNVKSEALHKALGFTVLGTYHNTGYKNGQWHDVIWFEKQIAPYDAEPLPMTPITGIPAERLQALICTPGTP